MGFVEGFVEHLSAKFVFYFLVFATILYVFVVQLDAYIRFRRLGKHGHSLNTWIPWGIDVISESMTAAKTNKSMELWRDVYFGRNNVTTVEANLTGIPIVFTSDPENIKAILATQFSDFGKGEPFHKEWKPFLGDSIFATDGHQWHTSRQMLRPQFTRDRVSDLDCFESHMNTLFRAMANGGALQGEDQPVDMAQGNGRVIDIADLFYRYTLDVATDFLLGADVKSLSTPKQEFAEAFNSVQHQQNLISRAGKFRFLISKKKYYQDLDVINGLIERFISLTLRMTPEELESKKRSDKKYTFLHELALFTRDPKVIRDQIIAVLLAGRDTTAGTLSWIIYELARHPECLVKLRREMLETVGPKTPPTYENIKNMPYLRAVINEALRLYPSVPFNVRLALKDTTIPRGGGPDGSEPLPVLKDTRVGYSTLVMQRRPDLHPPVSDKFADVSLFSPERWFAWHPKPHEYIPFNAGPRICIGQQFALTEMSYVLIRMFQRFERLESHMFELDGGEPTLRADVVLSPGQGVHVAFFEAQS